jgi:hypothetical protein
MIIPAGNESLSARREPAWGSQPSRAIRAPEITFSSEASLGRWR